MNTTAVSIITNYPDVIKEIRGVSPLAGKITLNFKGYTNPATIQVNDGPEMVLGDYGTYWQPIGLLKQ